MKLLEVFFYHTRFLQNAQQQKAQPNLFPGRFDFLLCLIGIGAPSNRFRFIERNI